MKSQDRGIECWCNYTSRKFPGILIVITTDNNRLELFTTVVITHFASKLNYRDESAKIFFLFTLKLRTVTALIRTEAFD